ncbi:MAG: PocR ligand-binding domain-containing protein, partial [Lachnospiraceae bacterium]|nr:PocR ligand-binding domain-containing protein [Lachnospiraceae bacterium]
LESFLKDFYNITQIRITMFDENFNELVSYPHNIASACRIIRTDSRALSACMRCDREACQKVKNQHSSYIYRCHAGLTEAISPIRMGNIVIGYLFFGHVFPYTDRETGYRTILQNCAEYQIDHQQLLEACAEMPSISKDYILSASRLLEAVASYLCLERMVVLKQQSLPIQIDRYITEHLKDDLSIEDICEHFQIGKTQLCDIAKHTYGKGIASQIRCLRIQRAKELLDENPASQIADIAYECGFNDYNYFISLFKKMTGMTPKQYQKSATRPQP